MLNSFYRNRIFLEFLFRFTEDESKKRQDSKYLFDQKNRTQCDNLWIYFTGKLHLNLTLKIRIYQYFCNQIFLKIKVYMPGIIKRIFFALVEFRRRILLEAHINSDWPWWDIRWAPVRRRSSRFCWSRIIRTWCASRSGHPVDCWACLPSNTARNLSRPSWLVRTSYQGSDSGRWRVWERISSTL